MRISKQARRDGKALFRACLVGGQLEDGRVRQALAQVLALKPRGHHAIVHHFRRLVRLQVARRTARVESAVGLGPAQRAVLEQNLARRYGAGLSLSFGESPSLIGGLRVQVGSDVYDSSIQARLAELSQAF
jgi:F-type H+-transporting ATPase subunit delta